MNSMSVSPKHLAIQCETVLNERLLPAGGEEKPRGRGPQFTEKPQILPNEDGTLITMKCRVKSTPPPEITWFKETELVQSSARVSMTTTQLSESEYEVLLLLKVSVGGRGGERRWAW